MESTSKRSPTKEQQAKILRELLRARQSPNVTDAQMDDVDRRRKYQAERSRQQFAKASDIGEIPPIKNLTRRLACKYDLHLFEQTYFPHSTGLGPFGKAQTNVLERIQGAILRTGRILNCEPRGFAKSTKSENAIIWAALYGHRSYAVFFGATGNEASDAINSIKSELQENDLLYEDFPEVCHAIRKLEGRPQRCLTQTHNGNLTHINWTADSIVLPTVDGSVASGAIIESKGYLSASRGIRYKRPDGKQVRPDLVVIDDPQTDESAVSPAQVLKRMTLLSKNILRLGGHGKQVAAVMNATVIADGDMVDQLADHKLHPEWQSVRVKMLESMPKGLETHWLTTYKQMRGDYDPDIIGEQRKAHRRATQFYVDNQDIMDDGAEVAWHFIPLEDGEVSAIQHAMNIMCDDGEEVFSSECQNEPKRATQAGTLAISKDEILDRYSSFDRYVLPQGTAAVVAHCDVHDSILYWSVAAVKNDFTGSIIDYGTFPEQPNPHFSQTNVKRKMIDELGAQSIEEAIVSGVHYVGDMICSKVYATSDGDQLPIASMLFDVGYKPEEVSKGIRLSRYANVMAGSRGVGIGPTEKPMAEYDVSAKKMRRAGPNPSRPRWYVPRIGINSVPVLRFDANYWKSVAAARLMQKRQSAGEWNLWGNHRTDHSHYCSHLIGEEPVPTTAKGRTVVMWKPRPATENHWFDTFVGCVVAASFVGIQTPGGTQTAQVIRRKPKQRRSFVDF